MYYFASDMHFGMDSAHRSADITAAGAANVEVSVCPTETAHGSSRERERLFIRWLDEVSTDAKAIFLVGDVFDFWFEYKRVIPKGFSRLLGKLSELTDRGIAVHFFPGNHDMWAYDYLSEECGLVLHHEPCLFELSGKKVFVGHGDNMYTDRPPLLEHWMQRLFRSRSIRRMFAAIVHPDSALRFGKWWSGKSRKARSITHTFTGEEEYLVKYARKYMKDNDADYFVFGHLHCAENYDMGDGKRMVILGEWITNPSYAILNDDGKIELRYYK